MIFQPPLKIQIEIQQASDQFMDGQMMDGGMDGWMVGMMDGQTGGIKETGGCYTEKCMDPGGLDMTGKVRVLHPTGIQPVAGQSMDRTS